ncbi:hypothetical protein H632_c1005p0, partial [Helicosporidium sp. ATCC 50920]
MSAEEGRQGREDGFAGSQPIQSPPRVRVTREMPAPEEAHSPTTPYNALAAEAAQQSPSRRRGYYTDMIVSRMPSLFGRTDLGGLLSSRRLLDPLMSTPDAPSPMTTAKRRLQRTFVHAKERVNRELETFLADAQTRLGDSLATRLLSAAASAALPLREDDAGAAAPFLTSHPLASLQIAPEDVLGGEDSTGFLATPESSTPGAERSVDGGGGAEKSGKAEQGGAGATEDVLLEVSPEIFDAASKEASKEAIKEASKEATDEAFDEAFDEASASAPAPLGSSPAPLPLAPHHPSPSGSATRARLL